ncbi:hypothetical protein ABWF04_06345 [Pasteurella multocida]|uniref:hypothetical protein n=1 Tax=Pasteurella multocida TaxID=747 RepID=UPI003978837E
MKNTTDHSYEGIQQALQIAVDSNNDLQLASEQSGIPKRTLYRYFERMQKGQPIRGVHSRRGTSALFRVDEHGQVQFEITPSTKKVRGNATMNEIMEQLERIDVKLSALTECVNQLKTLQMEG